MKVIFYSKEKALEWVNEKITEKANIASKCLDRRTEFVDKFLETYKPNIYSRILVRLGVFKPLGIPTDQTKRFLLVTEILSDRCFCGNYHFYLDYQLPWEVAVERVEQLLKLRYKIEKASADAWEFDE